MSYSDFFGGARLFTNGTWLQWEVATSGVNGQLYIKTTATASHSTDPSADPTNWKPHGALAEKPVQSGVAVLGGGTDHIDVTVTAVDLNKARPRIVGISWTTGTATDQLPSSILVRPIFQSTTVLRLQRTGSGVYAAPLDIAWEIQETV